MANKFNPDIHHRHSIRLKGYDYSKAGAYFVTLCAWNRECLFGDVVNGEMQLNECGQVVYAYWKRISDNFQNVEVSEYVVMPNHFHGIVTINIANDDVGAIHELPLPNETSIKYRKERRKMLLPKIIGWVKMNSAKHVNQLSSNPGCPIWQRNYYDHVIRTEDSLNHIRDYIHYNPARWGEDIENPVIWNEKKAKAYYKEILQ